MLYYITAFLLLTDVIVQSFNLFVLSIKLYICIYSVFVHYNIYTKFVDTGNLDQEK